MRHGFPFELLGLDLDDPGGKATLHQADAGERAGAVRAKGLECGGGGFDLGHGVWWLIVGIGEAPIQTA